MRTRAVSIRRMLIGTGGIALFLLCIGCAPREMAGTAQRPAGSGGVAGRDLEAPRDTAGGRSAAYNLEEEMPEKAPQRPAELVEKLEPIAPDTINVQDISIERTPGQRYDIGYRIQIFASSERAAAEKVKERFVAETRLATYIEYEDGLYKVRAGDFAERKDAAQARLKIAGGYPGSWIVRTTIRK